MRQTVIALATGILFGAGLAVSDMVNPARVLAFLDIFGSWDPALAFVMAGAIIPSAIAYSISNRLRQPLLDGRFFIPENRIIDRKLIAGATIFGAGWGLVGYCPGPAIAGIAFGDWQPIVFSAAMLAGMFLHRFSTDLIETRKSIA
ncbi:DUF6691 family protein [Erythrobacter ani]|uniref:YeeE/YedE family protein n=1 Tax=Erythrobacter ani TaxID=2827235 RepID=A0ABS6SLG1_9SPHN|nr:DUF6691 family protein [Erythrobacter ani]MBV7265479.1 YeeE/YedE family protein [Erythrobacter ani]